MFDDAGWSVIVDPSAHTARLVGEFDYSNTPFVYEALSTMSLDTADLRVDVSQVTFCSSALLRALIVTRNRLVDGGASMTLDPVSSVVQRILNVTETTSLFTLRSETCQATAVVVRS